jgi:metal-responsive CopG/Arc/MetJ family transcriptional regulator
MRNDTHMSIRISAEHGKKLDELRRREPDMPSRSEMIRRLIEREKVAK